MKKARNVTISIQIPLEVLERLEDQATKENKTRNKLIRETLSMVSEQFKD
jgi:predicted DNA-binding protein